MFPALMAALRFGFGGSPARCSIWPACATSVTSILYAGCISPAMTVARVGFAPVKWRRQPSFISANDSAPVRYTRALTT